MICISPERLSDHIRYLKQLNLRGVSMRELRRAMATGNTKGLIGFTFDDGYEDFLHTAVPILERYGFSATVFVVAGMLGKENDWKHTYEPRPRIKLLDAEDIREISERGMEVGSHSLTHPKLSGIEPEQLKQNVSNSRRVLSEILGEDVQGFCYPYGSLDKAAVQAVQRAGYSYACGVKTRAEHGDYDLPRIPLSQRDNYLRLIAKLIVYS